MRPEWLKEQTSVAEIEQQYGYIMDPHRKDGPVRAQWWTEFKAKIKPGDILRKYATPSKLAKRGHPWAGVILIRGGKKVDRYALPHD